MQPEDRNLAYLWDMLEAAREIIEFIKGVRYTEFVENRMLRYAVERQLMVIGEAANHISKKFQDEHPEIPWRQMVGQRNVLAHEYGDINIERVWSTATNNIPAIQKAIEPLVPEV